MELWWKREQRDTILIEFVDIKQWIKDSSKVLNSVKNLVDVGSNPKNRVYDVMSSVIESLNKKLEREDTIEERRSEILDFMNSIINKASHKDSEFKNGLLV